MNTSPASHETGSLTAVERHSIDYIPVEERHGRPYRLFFVWWSSNMQVTTIVTGVLAAIFGLSFPWALVAIVAGCLLGNVLAAAHSAQGPTLGIPQMIQSRAQFGFVGAILPVALVLIMYIGFFSASNYLGAQALNASLPGVPVSAGIVVIAAATVLLAVLGYRAIHRAAEWSGYLFFVLFTVLTLTLWARGLIPAAAWRFGPFQPGPFLLMLATAAIWVISYAPYVSDYSRYLPEGVSRPRVFWFTFWGLLISSVWMLGLGALLGVALPKSIDAMVPVLLNLAGPFGLPVMVVIVLGIVFVDSLNAYGAALCTLTLTEFGRDVLGHGRRARVSVLIAVGLIAAVIGVAGQQHFLTLYLNFLFLLLYLLIPWSAVNLIDFYVIQRGHYRTRDFFDASGPYRGLRWGATISYLVGFAVEIPFMNTVLYEGPVAHALNGGDVSWIIGAVVSAGCYLALSGGRRSAGPAVSPPAAAG